MKGGENDAETSK